MAKRKTAIAAAVKAATGGNSVFVFASSKEALAVDDTKLEQVFASAKYGQFSCNACGTLMQARADTSPFCITCGSGEDHVHAIEGNANAVQAKPSDLVAVHCSSCNHSNVLESKVVNAITAMGKRSPIHCSCCGSEMIVKAAAEDGSMSDTELKVPDTAENPGDDFDDVDVEASDKKQATASGQVNLGADADESVSDDDEDLDIDDLNANVENFKGKQAPPFKSKSTTANELFVPDDQQEASLEDDIALDPYTIDEVDDVAISNDPFGDDMTPVATTEEFVGEEDFGFAEPEGDPLVDALEMDDTDVALAFVKANGRVIAMKGHVAIASFSKASAGENYKLANSGALPIAATAAVKAEGLRKGLKSIGFALINVPATKNAVVARKVQEVTASMQRKETERRKEFASIFALAAAGLNRGEWRGHENPLRAAMENELTKLGVRSPRRVVSSIFQEAGVEYAQTLLQVSDKLSKLSASGRKELADMLQMTQITSAAEKDAEEDEDGDDDSVESTTLEARLSTPALLRPKQVISSSALAGASEVLSGKAPLSFASV